MWSLINPAVELPRRRGLFGCAHKCMHTHVKTSAQHTHIAVYPGANRIAFIWGHGDRFQFDANACVTVSHGGWKGSEPTVKTGEGENICAMVDC